MKNFKFILAVLTTVFSFNNVNAHDEPHLHLSNRWKECSFQIDPSLTQEAWHQFSQEAGLVTYFRSVTDAKPLGAGRIEFSVLQWNTRINESDDAWNNTFVHPNEEHWLIGGEELPFPGISMRVGISRKIDGAIYWSKRPGANYGVFGGQFQYNFLNDTVRNWAVSTRASLNSLYGPEDLTFQVCGIDVLASKKIKIIKEWAFVSPYVGLSYYQTHAHERTDKVNLNDENISAFQGMAGAVLNIKMIRLGVEYNVAEKNTLSYKLGFNFKF